MSSRRLLSSTVSVRSKDDRLRVAHDCSTLHTHSSFPLPARTVLGDLARFGEARPFGRMGFYFQLLESRYLKESLKVPPGTGAVLVNRLVPVAAIAAVLRAGDAVTAIDGVPVADDGTVAFRDDERIAFGCVRASRTVALRAASNHGHTLSPRHSVRYRCPCTPTLNPDLAASCRYLLTSKFLGDDLAISIIRDGAPLTVHAPLEDVPDLVPRTLYERKPQYVVHCGLVFTPLSEPVR